MTEVIEFYEREAVRLRGQLEAEILAIAEFLDYHLKKLQSVPEYTPDRDGLVKGYANRIDTLCARLATMREMLSTLRSQQNEH